MYTEPLSAWLQQCNELLCSKTRHMNTPQRVGQVYFVLDLLASSDLQPDSLQLCGSYYTSADSRLIVKRSSSGALAWHCVMVLDSCPNIWPNRPCAPPWFQATNQASLRLCPRAKLTIKHWPLAKGELAGTAPPVFSADLRISFRPVFGFTTLATC